MSPQIITVLDRLRMVTTLRPASLIGHDVHCNPGPSLNSPWVHYVAKLASDPQVSVALHLQTWQWSSIAADIVVEAG